MNSTQIGKVAMSEKDTTLPVVEVPTDEAGIGLLRVEIDAIDAELVRLIKKRTAVSHAIGAARMAQGGPRISYSREIAILDRFRDLGQPGSDLAMLLLAMGRGKLGRGTAANPTGSQAASPAAGDPA
ncbi:chorismate mutase [Nakamurella antarctica]|uniref:Chorismate mutase n=2 Tax=Nakamurella antarctica TaxID=1902245 RepID=A0A3G8ZS26_9ACTN|nr:chorismate mutase [Nakamurella antarctica]